MAWFAVIDNATGNLVSVGEVVASPLPNGLVSIALAGRPLDTEQWNSSLRQFEPRPAPTRSADQVAADSLVAKATGTWTTSDLATALRLLIKQGRF